MPAKTNLTNKSMDIDKKKKLKYFIIIFIGKQYIKKLPKRRGYSPR